MLPNKGPCSEQNVPTIKPNPAKPEPKGMVYLRSQGLGFGPVNFEAGLESSLRQERIFSFHDRRSGFTPRFALKITVHAERDRSYIRLKPVCFAIYAVLRQPAGYGATTRTQASLPSDRKKRRGPPTASLDLSAARFD